MSNFKAHVRVSYQDMTGLVLDLRSDDLVCDEGAHDGVEGAAILTDSSKAWPINGLVGKVVQNITDSSYGVITANTATTVTATLADGTNDDWSVGDVYSIQADSDSVLRWRNRAPARRIHKAAYSGVHDGGDNEAALGDSTNPWEGRDLAGMALHNVTDGSSGWITANDDGTVTATLAGGTDDDWDDDDEYEIVDPRFGDVRQATPAYQPIIRTVDGYKLATLISARTLYLEIPAGTARVPYPLSWWTVAIEKWNGVTGEVSQVLLSLNWSDDLSLWRKYDGDYTFVHGAGVVAGSGDMPDGLWLLQGGVNDSDATLWLEGVVDIIAGNAVRVSPSALSGDASDVIGYIGCNLGESLGNYLDGQIRSLQIWDRPMSPLEVDFAFKTLAADGDNFSAEDRATMSLQVWTDDSGDYSRINQNQINPQRYVVATLDGKARVQIVAAVAGKVRPDSELDSELFQLSVIEVPGATPMVLQDDDWSAVFDLVVDSNYPGHYCYLLSRENGGGVIVHFNVEAAA